MFREVQGNGLGALSCAKIVGKSMNGWDGRGVGQMGLHHSISSD
jgi:hypothetical protein